MVGGHAVEGFGLRELHALFLLHEAFRSEGAFHEVARAARKGVLFKHDGLEAAFNGFNRGNRAAGTGAHDDEVGRQVLVGPGGQRHCSGNGKSEGFNLGHGNFSFFSRHCASSGVLVRNDFGCIRICPRGLLPVSLL